MEQLQIPFANILEILEEKRQKRVRLLRWKSWFNEDQIAFLLKITFDLTDKDFEYLVAYLLEKEWYNISTFGKYHKGIDLEARRNGKTLYIQCKQLSNAYITEQKAGAFCGLIGKNIKEVKSNESFYYVTTSYVIPDASAVFARDGVKTISNKELLGKCEKCGLFTEEWWKDLIKYIREKRVQDLIKSRKIWSSQYDEIKKTLRTQRINEFKNHFPLSVRWNQGFKAYIGNSWFINRFFQYWDLV